MWDSGTIHSDTQIVLSVSCRPVQRCILTGRHSEASQSSSAPSVCLHIRLQSPSFPPASFIFIPPARALICPSSSPLEPDGFIPLRNRFLSCFGFWGSIVHFGVSEFISVFHCTDTEGVERRQVMISGTWLLKALKVCCRIFKSMQNPNREPGQGAHRGGSCSRLLISVIICPAVLCTRRSQ